MHVVDYTNLLRRLVLRTVVDFTYLQVLTYLLYSEKPATKPSKRLRLTALKLGMMDAGSDINDKFRLLDPSVVAFHVLGQLSLASLRSR